MVSKDMVPVVWTRGQAHGVRHALLSRLYCWIRTEHYCHMVTGAHDGTVQVCACIPVTGAKAEATAGVNCPVIRGGSFDWERPDVLK